VYLEDLDWSFHVLFVELVRPSIDIIDVSKLTGDADAIAETNSHASIGESLQRIFLFPPFLADQICSCDGAAAPFARLAMYDRDSLSFLRICLVKVMQPVPHAAHNIRYQCERRRVVVWPGKMVDAPVDFRVGIPCAFGAKFPDTPICAMF
jgi:hypothetical protein